MLFCPKGSSGIMRTILIGSGLKEHKIGYFSEFVYNEQRFVTYYELNRPSWCHSPTANNRCLAAKLLVLFNHHHHLSQKRSTAAHRCPSRLLTVTGLMFYWIRKKNFLHSICSKNRANSILKLKITKNYYPNWSKIY